jgi:protein phosphatase
VPAYGSSVKASAISSIGPVRQDNEDGLLWGEIFIAQNMPKPLSLEPSDRGLAAVADGIGGGPGGKEAAFLVLSHLAQLNSLPLTPDSQQKITSVLGTAARNLSAMAKKNPAFAQMGTTLAGLWFDRQKGLIFNCGDSRVYRLRAGFFDLLSQDHSLVYELYSQGQIAEEEMAKHPLKNILTASIQDHPEKPRLYFREIIVEPGDHFFICSDGVWEALSRPELEKWAELGPQAGGLAIARELHKKAQDNFTFIWLY